MPDPKNKRSGRSAPTAQVEQEEVQPAAEATQIEEERAVAAGQPPQPEAAPDQSPTHQPAATGDAAIEPASQPTAQVIDLDAVRAEERNATLAYVAEVHELCAIAGRDDLAAGFVAKATPVAQIRHALLEARAAEDEASAIRSQVRPANVEPPQPVIDTQAIYAARNQNVR